MESKERTWGVTPLPERLRTLSFLDVGLLWASLGVSLLVLVAGALLAPLGLAMALLAIAVGAVAGCALLGLAGLIGAERRVPGMVLLRAPLGHRGSYAPTTLNVLQNLGWATFELIVIAAAASALADRVFGFRERWVWVLVFGTVTVLLALAGPISFARRYVRRVAVWAVAASVGYLAWWAVDGANLGALWSAGGEGGLTFWQGVDLTVAMAASWLPLAADYTRFARSGRGAFWGTALGYLVPLGVLYALGALLVLSRDQQRWQVLEVDPSNELVHGRHHHLAAAPWVPRPPRPAGGGARLCSQTAVRAGSDSRDPAGSGRKAVFERADD